MQIPLKKVRFFITKDAAKHVVERLHDMGNVQIIDGVPEDVLTVEDQENFSHREHAARLESAVAFLLPFVKESDPMRAMFEGTKVVTTKAGVDSVTASHNTEEVLNTAHTLQTRLIEIDAELKSLSEEARIVSAWERLDFPLNDIHDTAHTLAFPIHGTARELSVLEEKLSEEREVTLERVGDFALLIVAHTDAREVVTAIINESEAEVLRLPDTSETAKEALVRIEARRASLEEEKATVISNAETLAEQELDALKQVADSATWTEVEIDTFAKLPGSHSVTIFDAWVPAPNLNAIQKTLEGEFSSIAFEERELADGEVPPTQIENRGLVYPFEFITRLYGVPGSNDLDPTPFLSVFFFLFFGLCLSDFGYGSTLMLLTGTVLLRYKVLGGMRQLLITLFFGGLGAALTGILYGGYFGVNASEIHPALAALQQFDPIGNPMPVFYLALAMGVVQVMFGIVLDIVRAAKVNDTLNGILDNGPWLLMFLILIAFTISGVGILPAGISAAIAAWWSKAAIGAAALISLTQARKGKGIIDMALKGALALYGGVNYFSDILSYSRLLALGLATSALGFSINLIAGIVGGDSLGIGTIFAVLILLAGHTLNLTLSSLGAFIHSSRLQYVEFFGKFLQDTGKPFMPFARKTKHTILLPEKPG